MIANNPLSMTVLHKERSSYQFFLTQSTHFCETTVSLQEESKISGINLPGFCSTALCSSMHGKTACTSVGFLQEAGSAEPTQESTWQRFQGSSRASTQTRSLQARLSGVSTKARRCVPALFLKGTKKAQARRRQLGSPVCFRGRLPWLLAIAHCHPSPPW